MLEQLTKVIISIPPEFSYIVLVVLKTFWFKRKVF